MSNRKVKAGVYISMTMLPHPSDASKIYPANVPFEIKGDSCEDSWVVMQVEEGVFKPVQEPTKEDDTPSEKSAPSKKAKGK